MSRFSYFGSEKIKVIISTVNKKQLEESLKRQKSLKRTKDTKLVF